MGLLWHRVDPLIGWHGQTVMEGKKIGPFHLTSIGGVGVDCFLRGGGNTSRTSTGDTINLIIDYATSNLTLKNKISKKCTHFIICLNLLISYFFIFYFQYRKANLDELNADLKKEAENLKKFDSKHVVRLWGIVTDNGMCDFHSEILLTKNLYRLILVCPKCGFERWLCMDLEGGYFHQNRTWICLPDLENFTFCIPIFLPIYPPISVPFFQ